MAFRLVVLDHMGRMVIRSAIDGSLGYGRPEWEASRSTPVLIEPSLNTQTDVHVPISIVAKAQN